MKITMGLDRTDNPPNIRDYVRGGADDFFAGYVPPAWYNKYGWEISPNRRPFGPDCQFTNLSELKTAARTVHEMDASITLTLNAHQHCADQLDLIERLVDDMEESEPDAYMVADPAIIVQLKEWGVDRPLHLSTGLGAFNAETVRYACDLAAVRRVVMPRKMSFAEMETLVCNLDAENLEFEAMVLGYRCIFNDEYCFTWHCGARDSFCKHFAQGEKSVLQRYPHDWKMRLHEMLDKPDEQLSADSALDDFVKEVLSKENREQRDLLPPDTPGGGQGLSGRLAHELYQNCGLCAIDALGDAGINVLKLPSRGQSSQKLKWLHMVQAVLSSSEPAAKMGPNLIDSSDYCAGTSTCYYGGTGEE